MKRFILFSVILSASIYAYGQYDDIYYEKPSQKKSSITTQAPTTVVIENENTQETYQGSTRNVDEYNRWGSSSNTNESAQSSDNDTAYTEDFQYTEQIVKYYNPEAVTINDPQYVYVYEDAQDEVIETAPVINLTFGLGYYTPLWGFYNPWYTWNWGWYDPWYNPWYNPWHGSYWGPGHYYGPGPGPHHGGYYSNRQPHSSDGRYAGGRYYNTQSSRQAVSGGPSRSADVNRSSGTSSSRGSGSRSTTISGRSSGSVSPSRNSSIDYNRGSSSSPSRSSSGYSNGSSRSGSSFSGGSGRSSGGSFSGGSRSSGGGFSGGGGRSSGGATR
ncbi:MAG: hypothetical protein EOL95_01465 [Bacteroidia bacterium]|nr:hypothetical protein [Bacteroidia bacterium]